MDLTKAAAGVTINIVKIIGEVTEPAFPYLSIVTDAAKELEQFCKDFKGNQDATRNLPEDVRKVGKIVIEDMAKMISPDDESFQHVLCLLVQTRKRMAAKLVVIAG